MIVYYANSCDANINIVCLISLCDFSLVWNKPGVYLLIKTLVYVASDVGNIFVEKTTFFLQYIHFVTSSIAA